MDDKQAAGKSVAGLVAMLCLAACASQGKLREADLAELAQWLPGQYDNIEQARSDAQRVGPRHEALSMAIVPVYAPGLGKYAFYVQEMAADDPRRVTAQRVFAFDVVDESIVQAMYSLVEPVRWRDAHLRPDLFKGLIPHQDVRRLAGCDLLWKKEHARYTAANDPQRCRVPSRATGAMVSLDVRTELSQGELAMSDRSYDASGRLVYGHPQEPYRFVKRASE